MKSALLNRQPLREARLSELIERARDVLALADAERRDLRPSEAAEARDLLAEAERMARTLG
jgi:hypothetical protein